MAYLSPENLGQRILRANKEIPHSRFGKLLYLPSLIGVGVSAWGIASLSFQSLVESQDKTVKPTCTTACGGAPTPEAAKREQQITLEDIKTMLKNTWPELSGYIDTLPLDTAEGWINLDATVKQLKKDNPDSSSKIDDIFAIHAILTGELKNYGPRPISLGVKGLGMEFADGMIAKFPEMAKTMAAQLIGPDNQPSPLSRPTVEQKTPRLYNLADNPTLDAKGATKIMVRSGELAGANITVDTFDNVYVVTYLYALDILKQVKLSPNQTLWDALTPAERHSYAVIIMNIFIQQRINGSVEWGQRTIYYMDENGKLQPLLVVNSGKNGFVACEVIKSKGETARSNQDLQTQRVIIVDQTASDPSSINIEVPRGQRSRNGDISIMLTVDISKMEAIVAPYAKSPNAAAQMLISTLNQTAAYEIADVDSASNGKDHVQDPLAINQVDLGYTLTGKTAQEVALMQGLVTLYRPCGVGKSATPAPNKSSELPPPPPKQTPAPEKPPAGPNTDPNGNEVTPLTPPPGPPPDSFPR